jgi:phosphatidylglycerophosphatase A
MWFNDQPQWLFPYPGWVTAFIFFRLFDIWKPWIVGWADRMHTPLGVMLDDVLAGILAAVVVTAAAGFAHGVLM